MTDTTRSGSQSGPQALSTAISAVLTVSATAAGAQEQAPAVTGLGEVIVTATKRAESMQEVAQSIMAIDSDSCVLSPNIIAPRHSGLTFTPVRPKSRYSTRASILSITPRLR